MKIYLFRWLSSQTTEADAHHTTAESGRGKMTMIIFALCFHLEIFYCVGGHPVQQQRLLVDTQSEGESPLSPFSQIPPSSPGSDEVDFSSMSPDEHRIIRPFHKTQNSFLYEDVLPLGGRMITPLHHKMFSDAVSPGWLHQVPGLRDKTGSEDQMGQEVASSVGALPQDPKGGGHPVLSLGNPGSFIFLRLQDMTRTAQTLAKSQGLPVDTQRQVNGAGAVAELQPWMERKTSSNGRAEVKAKDQWKLPVQRPFTTAVLGSLMLFIIVVVMVLAVRVQCRNRHKSPTEWIRHPPAPPSSATSDAVQPQFDLFQPDLGSDPVRIKAKGLLERRGSNASLRIDLDSCCDSDFKLSPSKECTPREFLMTAGSRLSRRQLKFGLGVPNSLHAEFWQIPTNHPERSQVSGASDKNRYRTVLPNEETRVVLQSGPGSTPPSLASQYINANYVRGYDGEENAYIATQGPLAHTIEDLWLMTLQERSPAIVMITRLKEKGRVKCEPYLPSHSAKYGSVQVTVRQVLQKSGYAIRQILVQKGEERHVTLHFWFTSWPDHKAPVSAKNLLAMAAEVEEVRKDSGRPVIVHCSAGIGRTGCFIAISIGMKQLMEEDCVDILSTVCQMRLDRGGMVQTAEQYEFIHRALAYLEATLPWGEQKTTSGSPQNGPLFLLKLVCKRMKPHDSVHHTDPVILP